jgi:hypothetical protein
MATQVELKNATYECMSMTYSIIEGSERLQPTQQGVTMKVTAKQASLNMALTHGSRKGRKVFSRADILTYECKGNMIMIFKDEKRYAMENPLEHRHGGEWTLIFLTPIVNATRQLLPCYKVTTITPLSRLVYKDLFSSMRFDRADIVKNNGKTYEVVFMIHTFVQLHRHLCVDYGYTESIFSMTRFVPNHEPITYKDLKALNPFIEPSIMEVCRARREFCNEILKEAHHPKRVEYIINTYGFDAWANQDDGF